MVAPTPSPAAAAPGASFAELGLPESLLVSLRELGYESPSPIQAATIPSLLDGRDVLGQAQTGTGKTAAFALPILARITLTASRPQALVLVPTRELAIQVAEAFQRYAAHLRDFHVLPIYGGQSYGPQLSALKRGVHVIVGTPGRVIDHLDKGSLDLSQVRNLVLDEADEMLRMGFVDEVDRILRDTPASRQTALFSATMPPAIRRIAQTHLRDPAEITVASHTGTAANIRQRHWLVSGMHKLDALTRILEAEPFDAMIVFARTKLGTEELAVKLSARGFAAAAINGDMQQVQRERTIGQLKEGVIDILVATDVAARGLDVERISHVINYDVPTDAESYTHRIGRTGRAGRSGEAILFITPRERGLLKAIERSTRQPIALMQLPTIQAVNDVRIARFKASITETLAEGGLERLVAIIEDYERETDTPAIEIAAALAKLSRGGKPLLIDKTARDKTSAEGDAQGWEPPESGRAASFGDSRSDTRPPSSRAPDTHEPRGAPRPRGGARGAPYRVEVGSEHGVKPGNIVGAITNEAGIDYNLIGRVDIFDTYSIVELPPGLPKRVLEPLQKARIAGRPLRLRPVDDEGTRPAFKRRGPPAGGSGPGRGSQGGPQGVR